MGTAREMSYLGRDGHWRVGSSDRRAENPGRPQAGQEGPAGGTTPGGWWSAARTGPARVASRRSSRLRGGVPGARTGPGRGGSRPPGGRGRPRPRRRLPESGSAPLRGRGDLGRRAASAGHGGVEPGRCSAAAPRDPRGERGRDRAALPGRELRRDRGAGRGSRTGSRRARRRPRGPPLPFSHSFLVGWVLQWARAAGLGETSGPGARWRSSRAGGGGGRGGQTQKQS